MLYYIFMTQWTVGNLVWSYTQHRSKTVLMSMLVEFVLQCTHISGLIYCLTVQFNRLIDLLLRLFIHLFIFKNIVLSIVIDNTLFASCLFYCLIIFLFIKVFVWDTSSKRLQVYFSWGKGNASIEWILLFTLNILKFLLKNLPIILFQPQLQSCLQILIDPERLLLSFFILDIFFSRIHWPQSYC